MTRRPNGKSATDFVNGSAGKRQTSSTSATSAPRAEQKCFSRSGSGCGVRWARGTSTFVWCAAIEGYPAGRPWAGQGEKGGDKTCAIILALPTGDVTGPQC